MTNRDRPIVRIERWVLGRSGVTLLVFLVLFALALLPLSRFNPGLPSGLAFVAYLGWLLLVFMRLRNEGRRWSRSLLAWVPFTVLFSFALVIVPVQSAHGGAALSEANRLFAIFSMVSYVTVWDHVARALARRRGSAWKQVGHHFVTILLSLMPPFGVLWVQHQMSGE
jgi:hypothetical protein